MNSKLRGILTLMLLAVAGLAQAQEQPVETANPVFESFGIGIVFAVVGVMLAVLLYFGKQLWDGAREKQSQALTDKVAHVPAIRPASPQREAHGTALYVHVPPELEDAPTMVLELVKAPANAKMQTGQWFISQNRTPFVIGSGTETNQNLDVLLDSDFVSSFHLKIEFEPAKQRFVLIDTDSLNGTSFNENKMSANSRYPIPADKSAMIEIAHQYVFTAVQVKGKPVIEGVDETDHDINLGEQESTEALATIAERDFVATSKLPDAAEILDEMPQKASTGEVATLHEAPDMSNIAGVRYPLQNVDFPPLARLPEDIDAMIEILRSPQAEAATYTIWRTVYHIGRGDKTDLRLPGSMISNNHLSLYWANNTFWIIDTSLNQTWLRWTDNEIVLERGNPMKLEMGIDYQIMLARDDTLLRFRFVTNKSESDAKEVTLPPLPTAIRTTLAMTKIGKTDERKDFSVSSNRITIGRESTNLVQLDPQVVSRRHAEIVWKADAYYIKDKGSLYGVMVDDTMLPSGGERRLEAGQKYRIVLSPKQRDAVHLEFSYADRRTAALE